MGGRHVVVAAAILSMVFSNATSARASVACPTDMDVPTAASPAAVMALLCDVNTLRAREGLRPLRWDWRLWAGAQRMAGEMGREHFFSHETPDGRNLAERIAPTGYIPNTSTWLLAENLAWGQKTLSTPLATAIGWMNSPGHRRNMLDPKLEQIGIGMADATLGPGAGWVYVADFGTQGNVARRKAARAKRGLSR